MNELWLTMFLSNLLIPVLMIGLGLIYRSKKATKMSSYSGYRTKRSTKNLDTWNFAHQFYGRLLLKYGILMFFLTVMVMVLIDASDSKAMIIYGSILMVVLLIAFLYLKVSENSLFKGLGGR